MCIKPTLQTPYSSFDQDPFNWSSWESEGIIDHIIICTHGICGVHQDFEGLAQKLTSDDSGIAVCAYDTRSQGMDPIESRRGDIRKPELWYRDLKQFTTFVKTKYPHAKLTWFGESMGSMITLNSYAYWIEKGQQLCDQMILSAPVINIDKQLKPWQLIGLRIAANLVPSLRLSLNQLAGGQKHEITTGLFQTDDAAKNPYLVESFTLRFLNTFSKEVKKMHRNITNVSIPLAIVHGGKDFLSSPENIEQFFIKAPAKQKHRFFYPEAYHLILYDALREKIFTDLEKWLKEVN